MKRFFSTIFLFSFLVLGSEWISSAQAQSAEANIGLVDISYILKMHTQFKLVKEDIEAQFATAKKDIEKRKKEIQTLVEDARRLTRGSQEYKELDEEITKRQADLSVESSIKEKELNELHAKNVHRTYMQIYKEITRYAEKNGLIMVMSFNGEEVKPDKLEDINMNIRRLVVYHRKELDITPFVLEALNGRSPPITKSGRGGNPRK